MAPFIPIPRAALCAALMTLAGAAHAQSAPALRIAPPEDHDPSATVVRGESAPARPLHGAHTEIRYERDHRARPADTVQRFSCNSHGHGYTQCPAPHGRIRMVQRHSNASCREGRDWGISRGTVWVDNGCRATFEAR